MRLPKIFEINKNDYIHLLNNYDKSEFVNLKLDYDPEKFTHPDAGSKKTCFVFDFFKELHACNSRNRKKN